MSHLGLGRDVAAAFFSRFLTFTHVQTVAIPVLLSGADAVISAGTGCGKTEAAVAPLVARHRSLALNRDVTFLLYVAPTKALLNDLAQRLQPRLRPLGLNVGVRHGDRDDLKTAEAVHVLLTTPESLEVLLLRQDASLKHLRAVVVDEAHLFYNTQRGLQLSILIWRVERLLGGVTLQRCALSATLASLKDVAAFLFGSGTAATLIQTGAAREIDASIRVVPSPASFAGLVAKLCRRPTKLLTFVNSRRESELLVSALREVSCPGLGVFAHYSSLSGEVRQSAEREFASQRSAVCVATSTLELGIDIGDIDAVILWGAPSGAEAFLQRIGRGNRRQEKTNVVAIVPHDCSKPLWHALRFAALLAAARTGQLPVRRPFRLYGAVAQQCAAMIALGGGAYTRIADLMEAFTHLPHLARTVVEDVLAAMADRDVIQRHGFKNRYGANVGLYELVDHDLIYGNFGASSSEVDILHGRLCLGHVPRSNLLRVQKGIPVRFAGRSWVVERTSREGVHVRPGGTMRDAVDFAYSSKGVTADPSVCNRVWELLHAEPFDAGVFEGSLRDHVCQAREGLVASCPQNGVPVCGRPAERTYATFAGTMANQALGMMFLGEKGAASDVTLTARSPLPLPEIPSSPDAFSAWLPRLFEAPDDESIYQGMLPVPLRHEERTQVWLRDETVGVVLERLRTSQPAEVHSRVISAFG